MIKKNKELKIKVIILIDESKNRERLKFTEIEKLSKDVEFKSKELWIGELQFYRYRMD